MTNWAALNTPSGKGIKRVFKGDESRYLIEVDTNEWHVSIKGSEFINDKPWTTADMIGLGWTSSMSKAPIWERQDFIPKPRFKRLQT